MNKHLAPIVFGRMRTRLGKEKKLTMIKIQERAAKLKAQQIADPHKEGLQTKMIFTI